jgi:hypothetical protein
MFPDPTAIRDRNKSRIKETLRRCLSDVRSAVSKQSAMQVHASRHRAGLQLKWPTTGVT